jgi:hypothetical protein
VIYVVVYGPYVKAEKQKEKEKKKKGITCMDSNLAGCRFFRVLLGFTCHELAR